ncbi:MAG: transcription termination/antitermination NusG family protein [Pseudomonadota bacterium]
MPKISNDKDQRVLWYVIQTKPTVEAIVEQHLKNARFETFLPRIRSMVRSSKKPMSRVRSLFPSYLFAHLDLRDANLYRMIKYTRGVRRILGDGIVPTPVPDEMIEIIRSRMDGDGVIEQQLTMKKGDSVRVRSGVFRDLVGILEKPVSAAGRVKVLLKIMRHQVRCELSAADVERLTD